MLWNKQCIQLQGRYGWFQLVYYCLEILVIMKRPAVQHPPLHTSPKGQHPPLWPARTQRKGRWVRTNYKLSDLKPINL